jgi:hypothetical protein
MGAGRDDGTGPGTGDPVSLGLEVLGLRRGEQVRWRETASGRWHYGTVRTRERDGSIGVTADGGAARSLAVARLEVGAAGRRGARRWEGLTERAGRSEQLRLSL